MSTAEKRNSVLKLATELPSVREENARVYESLFGEKILTERFVYDTRAARATQTHGKSSAIVESSPVTNITRGSVEGLQGHVRLLLKKSRARNRARDDPREF